jgi:SulP family sulfate permease
MSSTKFPTSPLGRLKLFFTFFDSRWEDLTKENWAKTVYQDFSAGLIVAMTAIPMAMGFAMAMGMRPEHGIIAGALACIVGRTFGGSKYQVYGPTAAFIPIIAGLITKYGPASGGQFETAHGFLVLVSIIAGLILIIMGIFGVGKYAKLVPNSIIVGFTIGIAVAIAMTNFKDILGLNSYASLIGEKNKGILDKVDYLYDHLNLINGWTILLGVLTFVLAKFLLKISIYIPGPVIAMGTATLLSATWLADKNILLVRDLYGSIPNNFFKLQLPIMPMINGEVILDIIYFVTGIVFVSGVESVLCSSMADRLAKNDRTPFNPDKEFFGQGLVQIITPLVQGFPCTGALARTATSIKAGAKTPLAGYFKSTLKLLLAFYLAQYLELVPMACIGGILVWVASNMIKPAEIKEIKKHGKFEFGMMMYTALMVPLTDFLTGVLSALVIYAIVKYVFNNRIKTTL